MRQRGWGRALTRRAALGQLALLAAGLAAACTPLRIVMSAYPQAFDDDPDLVDRVLRAFVATIIPGAAADDPNLVRVYTDPYYPFAKYVAFFAADLCRRAKAGCASAAFDRLSVAQRTAVIEDGLAADATTRKLYQGAILLGQVSFYAGIYDDQKGCALIDFDGRYRFKDEIGYPDPERFLPAAHT